MGAAADQPNLACLVSQRPHQVKAVAQTEGGALHHRATQMGGAGVAAGQAEKGGAGLGQARYPFAVEERQDRHAIGADRRLGQGLVEPRQVETEQLTHAIGGRGGVHGADQRQPARVAGAEVGDHGGIGQHRVIGVGADGARGAKAHGYLARHDVAGADGAEHIVSAAAGDRDARGKPQLPGQHRPDLPCRVAGIDQSWQHPGRVQLRGDPLPHLRTPAP